MEADDATPAPGPRTLRSEEELDAFSEDVELSDSRARPSSLAGARAPEVSDPDAERAIEYEGQDADDEGGLGSAFDDAHLRATDLARPAHRPPPLPLGDAEDLAPPVSLTDPRLGETLNGRYRLEKLIGKGGMGRVYRATQFPLNRSVALKILSPEFQRKDPQFVRRFYLEAASAARLTHPNTITVFDYGEAESGELFIVMEYLRGKPLSRVLNAEGAFSAERTMHIGLQICRALREAHSKGIIHRDLKPGNILLLEEGDDADFVKVLDFGLVKLFTPAGSPVQESQEPLTPNFAVEGELTRAGMFLGSPKYMSPEQIQGSPLDPRTDVYSLGVLMFQMLAGKPPYAGTSSVEVIYKHVNAPIPRIAEIAPEVVVPEELELIVRQCLAKSRDERFASMAELLVRLKDVKRLVTGISAASEIGVSLAQLSQGPRAAHGEGGSSYPSPSTSHAGHHPAVHASARPHSSQQPSLVSGRVTIPPKLSSAPRPEPSGPPRATPVEREAAFVDIEDDTPSALVAGARGHAGAPGKLTRLAPVIAGTALVVVLGVGAYVLASGTGPLLPGAGGEVPAPRAGGTNPEPAPAPARKLGEVRVSFASTPAGAGVHDEDGAMLGTTPFTRVFPSPGSRRFVFKLEGFDDEVIEDALEDASVKLHARMRSVPVAEPPRTKPAKRPATDYKENPY